MIYSSLMQEFIVLLCFHYVHMHAKSYTCDIDPLVVEEYVLCASTTLIFYVMGWITDRVVCITHTRSFGHQESDINFSEADILSGWFVSTLESSQ